MKKDMQFLFQTEQFHNFPQYFHMVLPFPSSFPTKIKHAFLTCPLCATCPALTNLLDFIILIMPGL